MKKKLIWTSLLIAFLTWNFTSDIFIVTEPRAIRKVTEITALHLFGKRRIWTLDKSEQVFNKKGQTIEQLFYDGDVCNSKYVYTYNAFDSLEKIVWFASESLTPQEIEIWTFDSLNRKFQNLVYEISTVKPDTFLSEKTTWYYDKWGREFRTVIEHFSDMYPDSEGTTIFTDIHNDRGQVTSTTMSSYGTTNVTKYTYNEKGHVILKTGGLMDDSIVYVNNENGKVLEEREMKNGQTLHCDKYWYDDKGNKVKVYRDNEGGHTYEYKFDGNNKLIKEYRPGSFLLILKPCVSYSYDYY